MKDTMIKLCGERSTKQGGRMSLIPVTRCHAEVERCKDSQAMNTTFSPSLADFANVALIQGQRETALRLYHMALRRDPIDVAAHTGLGCWLLQGDEWEAGWQELEWRLHGERCTHAHWDGRDLCGASILVHLDDVATGVGDVVQFVRFVPWLKS